MRTTLFLLVAALLAAPVSAKTRLKTLLKDFEEGKTADRIRLAPALGRYKENRATALLIEAFDPRKGNPKETDAIVQGLGFSGDARAVEPLQAAWDFMRTTDMQLEGNMPGHLQVLRWRILEALSRIGGDAAVSTLSVAVNDSDARVVEEAVRGLGALQVKDAVPAIQTLAAKGGNLGQTAIEALGAIGDKRAISTLEQLLAGSDRYVEVQARYALIKLGKKEHLKPLEAMLEGDPGDGKAAILAAYYLVKLDKNSGLSYLDAMLKRKEEPLAPLAAEALGKTGNERAVLPLAEGLRNQDATVRLMAVRGLARLGGSRAVSAMDKAKSDSNAGVRNAAQLGLMEWGEFD